VNFENHSYTKITNTLTHVYVRVNKQRNPIIATSMPLR